MGFNIYDIARTDEFVQAWRAIIEKPITFREFSEMPMPHGCTAEDLWRCFAIQRRLEGIVFSVKPWFHSTGDVSWASLTKQTERELLEIASLAGPDSQLNQATENAAIRMALETYLIDELVPSCHSDGFDVPKDRLKQLWFGGASPDTPEEHAIVNLAAIFEDAASYATRPLSLATVERLHEDLTLDIGELTSLKRKGGLISSIGWTERFNDPDFAELMMQASMKDARAATTTTEIVVAFHEMSSVLWDLACYPSLNSLTELALRRVFFVKVGMPIMSFVPFKYLAGQPDNRFDRAFTKEAEYLSSSIGSEEGLDCTIILAGTISTLLKGLNILSERVEELQQQESEVEQQLELSQTLNHRQKDLLSIMRRDPTFQVRVRGYATMFGVVRATARADLLDLVEKGYLEKTMEDRAAVFRPVQKPTGE